MLDLNRICVPLSLDCNLHCKYCYRDKEKRYVPEFNEGMIGYLMARTPDRCEAVVASGGEPLLHWDRVKALFSYVPKNVHKKLMSNCILLTQEIVDYLNENEIELATSHDGPKTKFLRGYDILDNPKIRDLVKQVKILRIVNVVTKYNLDTWEDYFDTASRLGRCDFNYLGTPLLDIPAQHDLIDGFDYDKWMSLWNQFLVSPYMVRLPWYKGKTLHPKRTFRVRHVDFNVLPDGTVCGMANICSKYGTIYDTVDKCYSNLLAMGQASRCKDCKFDKTCKFGGFCETDHVYKWKTMMNEFWSPDNIANIQALRIYVRDHMEEIEKKYGFVRPT